MQSCNGLHEPAGGVPSVRGLILDPVGHLRILLGGLLQLVLRPLIRPLIGGDDEKLAELLHEPLDAFVVLDEPLAVTRGDIARTVVEVEELRHDLAGDVVAEEPVEAQLLQDALLDGPVAGEDDDVPQRLAFVLGVIEVVGPADGAEPARQTPPLVPVDLDVVEHPSLLDPGRLVLRYLLGSELPDVLQPLQVLAVVVGHRSPIDIDIEPVPDPGSQVLIRLVPIGGLNVLLVHLKPEGVETSGDPAAQGLDGHRSPFGAQTCQHDTGAVLAQIVRRVNDLGMVGLARFDSVGQVIEPDAECVDPAVPGGGDRDLVGQ